MPPKRPSFIGQLEKELSEPLSPTQHVETAISPKQAIRPGIRKNTLYLTDAVQERLREIAFTERCKVHDLFLEGIDHVIEQRGHAERATAKKV